MNAYLHAGAASTCAFSTGIRKYTRKGIMSTKYRGPIDHAPPQSSNSDVVIQCARMMPAT